MMEEYEEKAWHLLQQSRNITPLLIMRKFKLTWDYANKICARVQLRHRNEARAMAMELENYGFPAQLQGNAVRKNLEKFNGNKKKNTNS